MYDVKQLTQSVLALLIVLGGVASLFFPVNEVAGQVMRVMTGAVIGYYFGGGTLTFGRKK